jgi:hypothetical protein
MNSSKSISPSPFLSISLIALPIASLETTFNKSSPDKRATISSLSILPL